MNRCLFRMSLLRRFIAGAVVIAALAIQARAEVIARHPRVAELEDKLAKDASLYLKGRFPEVPFLVTVSISPLRRGEGYGGKKSGESLPYFETDTEELQDEWDDPQVSWGKLMMRVQKAAITLSLPASINDDEVAEVKDSLFKLLNLTPARDEIVVQRRNWSRTGNWMLLTAVAGLGLFLLIVGLYFTGRSAARQVGDALTAAAKTSGGGGGGASLGSAMPTTSASTGTADSSAGDGPGRDVQFSDPIRVREAMARLAQELSASKAFPTLDDMIELDALGAKSPALLGAVLSEFSESVRSRLFALSSSQTWLEALLHPGVTGFECLEVLQKLSRRTRSEKRASWEQLLIQVWRLGEERAAFLKGLNQEHAFAILGSMPKSISVDVGRRAFPGSWGVLLDPGFHPTALPETTIAGVSAEALELRPLSDLALLERYRHEVELIEYLKVADIAAEREIYEAASSDSLIHSMRPPFYVVLDSSEAELKKIVQAIGVEQWALALFNAPRTERLKIEKELGEKQRFLFIEKLRALDAHHPDKAQIGKARESIARFFKELHARTAAEEESRDENELKAAA
jgi:hypothetical protein